MTARRQRKTSIPHGAAATDKPLGWLEALNPSQREAVTAGAGPILVVAGAGTGKTRTLASRVAYLVDQGVPPDRILLLTFTRRAAAEMLHRASQLCGGSATTKVWGGTFHATANRLLRIYGRSLGLSPEFTVMDQGDAADLMNLLRNEMGLGKGDRRFPKKDTLIEIYSRMVNAQEKLEESLKTYFPWCLPHMEQFRELFDRYVARKQAQQVLDYDDLLLFWSALCHSPAAGAGDAVADRFDHLLVDEYQDTNAVQAEILLGMRRNKKDIMVVGDDAQSIYSFRAATIRNILDFPKQFPGTRIVTLEQNYRSTQLILDASNAVMESARERYTKNLWSQRRSPQKPVLVTCRDEFQQTDVVVQRVLEHLEQGTMLHHQAVLFRTGHHSAHLEIELARRKIPFHKFGGLKFVEAAHIKDVLSVLRVLENPYDEISWFRVLQMVEGVGPQTARRIMESLGVRREGGATPRPGTATATTTVSPLTRFLSEVPALAAKSREGLTALREALADCRGAAGGANRRSRRDRAAEAATDAPAVEAGAAENDPVADVPRGKEPALPVQLERIRRFYEPICQRLYDNAAVRLRDLDELAHIASGYRSRNRFITDLTLDPPQATSDFAGPPFLEEDYLILSTIHSAKGCEWDVVHVIHAADGMIPSDMAISDEAGVDEERRLFYVAMTRAKDMLYVYFPMRLYHRRFGLSDGHSFAQLTRFVTDEVRQHFECRNAFVDPQAGETGTVPPGSIENPYERVNRLWQA